MQYTPLKTWYNIDNSSIDDLLFLPYTPLKTWYNIDNSSINDLLYMQYTPLKTSVILLTLIPVRFTVRASVRRTEERAAVEKGERDKRVGIREKDKAKKVEFGKLRKFITDRIRMCRIKRVGRHQHYYGAKAKLEWELNMFRKRRQDDERRNQKRKERSRRQKKKRWTVMCERERSDERVAWEDIKIKIKREQYNEL